jgi:anti-sigma regulatory factor (Ser/Thr protein kinase)
MPPADRAPSGGARSGRFVGESRPGARLESVATERRHDATIDGLTVALDTLRRGAIALKGENHELRAEIAELGSGTASHRRDDFGELAEVALPARLSAPGAARIVVAGCLLGLVGRRTLEDAKLLITELVTNSLLHGELDRRDTVLVRIYIAADALRLEVENSGTAGAVAANGPDPQAGRGFGLEILERLVSHWGVRRDQGTTVWCEMGRV